MDGYTVKVRRSPSRFVTPTLIEVLANRHGELAGRAQQVANLGDGHAGAARQALAHAAAASPLRTSVCRKMSSAIGTSKPSATQTSNRSFKLAALPPAWPAKLPGSGGWKPASLKRVDHLVLELAQVGAQLRLEVGAGDPAQIADQPLLPDQPIHGGMHQARRRRRNRVAIAPLPVVRGHQRRFIMQPASTVRMRSSSSFTMSACRRSRRVWPIGISTSWPATLEPIDQRVGPGRAECRRRERDRPR